MKTEIKVGIPCLMVGTFISNVLFDHKVGAGLVAAAVTGLLAVVVFHFIPENYWDPEPKVPVYILSRGNTQLGEYSLLAINQLLGTRQLIASDYFFDSEAKQWRSLRELPGALIPVDTA